MLTLSEAIKNNRIKDFIVQEEARGIGPADREKLDAAIKRFATQRQAKGHGQTKFIRPDGSVGKEPGTGIVLIGAGAVACAALRNSGPRRLHGHRAVKGGHTPPGADLSSAIPPQEKG